MVMKNSFILYSEIDVEDDVLDCIYFIKGECWAQPSMDKTREHYKPTEEDQKNHCTGGKFFRVSAFCRLSNAFESDRFREGRTPLVRRGKRAITALRRAWPPRTSARICV